jgi:hypothetical protein
LVRGIGWAGPAVISLTLFAAAFGGSSTAGAAGVRPLAGALEHTRAGAHATTATSLNWAGYVKPGTGFTSNSASWHVPTLLTTDNGSSAMWVGIDGASSSDHFLIQTGIEADVVNHRATYSAWWEVITPSDPAPEVPFTGLAVRPGDSITGSVVKGTGGRWTMTLKDNTTKRSASHTSSYAGRGLSAEWIIEDTSVNGYTSAAPDWQSVAFTSILANKAPPALTTAEALNIVSAPGLLSGLLGGRGVQETSTGAPNRTRSGFGVTWLATGTRSQTG